MKRVFHAIFVFDNFFPHIIADGKLFDIDEKSLVGICNIFLFILSFLEEIIAFVNIHETICQ